MSNSNWDTHIYLEDTWQSDEIIPHNSLKTIISTYKVLLQKLDNTVFIKKNTHVNEMTLKYRPINTIIIIIRIIIITV